MVGLCHMLPLSHMKQVRCRKICASNISDNPCSNFKLDNMEDHKVAQGYPCRIEVAVDGRSVERW